MFHSPILHTENIHPEKKGIEIEICIKKKNMIK